jgi:xanthine dehydrogenase accessory factor
MSVRRAGIEAFVTRHRGAVLVRVSEASGSSPRDSGALMLVGTDETIGTIGGGQLEFLAIDRARRMLRDEQAAAALDVPLGPEIGQCCGGRVRVELTLLDGAARDGLLMEMEQADSGQPHVYVFGAGHVGRALTIALSALPVNTHLIDTRPETLTGMPPEIDARAAPMPEALVRVAPAGSAFVILTHDHALDFLIAREALAHPRASYVGMIGSKTKRAQFRRWFLEEGGQQADFERLVCPIAHGRVADKRPEVIAALAAAEILVHTLQPGDREVAGGHSLADASGGADVW